MSLVALASSAYVKWRVVAGAVTWLLLHPERRGRMIDSVFRVTWGYVIEPGMGVNQVWCALLGVEPPEGPGQCAWPRRWRR